LGCGLAARAVFVGSLPKRANEFATPGAYWIILNLGKKMELEPGCGFAKSNAPPAVPRCPSTSALRVGYGIALGDSG